MAYLGMTSVSLKIIDDDIRRTMDDILKLAVYNGSNYDKPVLLRSEVYRKLLETLTIAMQVERNGWKEKVQSALQEIDRQHKLSITVRSHLQELINTFHNEPPESDNSNEKQSTDLISDLEVYIRELQRAFEKLSKYNPLESTLKKLQTYIIQLEKENNEHLAKIQEKSDQIHLLRTELSSVNGQMDKLMNSVVNSNDSQSKEIAEKNVDTSKETLPALTKTKRREPKEDRIDSPTPEESSGWKLRAKQNAPGARKTAQKSLVTHCLRCQNLFKSSDNNAMACRFHRMGKEMKEKYDTTGRVCKILYKWSCCKRGLQSMGCTYGYHI